MLQELWQKFESEFLSALAHYYNEEDEREYIAPLRDAIMGRPTPHEADGLESEPKCYCPADGIYPGCPVHGKRRR